MNLYILNKSYETIAILDTFTSLIWTTRYYSAGDFELYLPASESLFEYIQTGNYIERDDSDVVMIIERIEITTDAENGDFVTITGRSIEALLARRIIWEQTTYNLSADKKVYKLIEDCCINASDTKRNISELSISAEYFTDLVAEESQYTGDNLYDVIVDLCTNNNMGMSMFLNNSKLSFSLFRGTDRTYSQDDNPYVVFSPKYENLVSSDYAQDISAYGNIAHTFGEGEGTDRKSIVYGDTTATGLNRCEVYIDARDVSQNADDEESAISDEDYLKLLEQRAAESMLDYQTVTTFSGEADNNTLVYKQDYYIGDKVQIENQYGFKETVRIIEVIESYDENGCAIVPTLEECESTSEEETLRDSAGYYILDSAGYYIDTEE